MSNQKLQLGEQIYQNLVSRVHHVLRRFGASSQDIEDIAHEVFVELMTQPELFEGKNEENLSRVVIWRAVRRVIDLKRRNRRYVATDMDSIEENLTYANLPSNGNLDERVMFEVEKQLEAKDLFEQALAVLNDNEKQVFRLHIVNGFTIKETAEILRGSDNKRDQSWVSQQKRRAIKKIRNGFHDG